MESTDTSGFDEDSFNYVAPLDDEMQDASLEPTVVEPAAKDTSDVDNASTGNNSLSVSLFVHTDDLQDDLDEDLRAVENGMDGGNEEKESEESPEKVEKISEAEEQKDVTSQEEKSEEAEQTVVQEEKDKKTGEEMETETAQETPETTEESSGTKE